MKMDVLSLFGGVECGYPAFLDNKIEIDNYYSCEIDPYAKAITRFNIEKAVDLGDVTKLFSFPKVDILIGGSPCQDLRPGRGGLTGEKSKLFYEYVRIKNEIKPKYFLLENVGKMKKEDKDIITNLMGVAPIRINSNLVTAQNRDRYYWTNIPNVVKPKDLKLSLIDVLQPLEDIDNKYIYTERISDKVKETFNLTKNYIQYDVSGKGYKSQQDRIYPITGKSPCIPANQGQNKMNIVYKINKNGNIKTIKIKHQL
jgi:site-specific DNA-cytosine methylase